MALTKLTFARFEPNFRQTPMVFVQRPSGVLLATGPDHRSGYAHSRVTCPRSTRRSAKEFRMSAEAAVRKPPSTLGLTGITVNAMALIAPGAFLWLTFFIQAAYGAPMAAQGMWFGIFAAVMLCLATAVAYAELSKLYPGAGSSYFFAEQAFLSKAKSKRFARIAKFTVGWASHLYYWGYPGLMVGVTALVVGYVMG